MGRLVDGLYATASAALTILIGAPTALVAVIVFVGLTIGTEMLRVARTVAPGTPLDEAKFYSTDAYVRMVARQAEVAPVSSRVVAGEQLRGAIHVPTRTLLLSVVAALNFEVGARTLAGLMSEPDDESTRAEISRRHRVSARLIDHEIGHIALGPSQPAWLLPVVAAMPLIGVLLAALGMALDLTPPLVLATAFGTVLMLQLAVDRIAKHSVLRREIDVDAWAARLSGDPTGLRMLLSELEDGGNLESGTQRQLRRRRSALVMLEQDIKLAADVSDCGRCDVYRPAA